MFELFTEYANVVGELYNKKETSLWCVDNNYYVKKREIYPPKP